MRELSRLLVVAPNWLGDAVMALPAIAGLRQQHAGANLTIAARSSVAALFHLVPGVNDVVELRWRGSPLRRETLRDDVSRIAAVNADAALLLPNSFAAAWLVKQAAVPARWGYATDLRRPLLTRPVRRPRRSMHQGAYYQHLVGELGVPAGSLETSLALPAKATTAAREMLAQRGWDGVRPLLVLAPGAAYGTAKRWLPAHFATVADMAAAAGAQSVLVGSRDDRAATEWVKRAVTDRTRGTLIDLTGETSLETLAAVLGLASACVSNDSGAMHLAGAVGTPLAALFGPTREYETAPLTTRGGRAEVLINPVWCRPCMLRECPIDHRCMTGLLPARVFETVQQLMKGA